MSVAELDTWAIDEVLDEIHPPVARLRVMSDGLSRTNLIGVETAERGCLACGNCEDSCPAMRGLPRTRAFARTSMELETMVGNRCRRCYRCVFSCPQVSPELKRYARSYRRVERVSHVLLAASFVLLGLSGISIFHWGGSVGEYVRSILGGGHRVAAIGLVLAPLLYLLLDRHHFTRMVTHVRSWGQGDKDWLATAGRFIRTLGRLEASPRGEFNSAQKIWYTFVFLALPVFAITGSIKWAGEAVFPASVVSFADSVHVVFAFAGDTALFVHLCLKVVLPWGRRIILELAAVAGRTVPGGEQPARLAASGWDRLEP